MLSVDSLHVYYGKSHILQGIGLNVGSGEIVSLIGRNGVGRSTTLKAIIGELDSKGSIRLDGQELAGMASHHIAQLGIAYVPENRDVFSDLTVTQNLELGVKPGLLVKSWHIQDILEMFPHLRERAQVPAGVLSGGEQQLLSLCRSLLGNPSIILIDEPTEGLAPKIVDQVAGLIREIADRGTGVLLVEQKLAMALNVSTHLYVMGRGKIVFAGSPEDLQCDPQITDQWLKV
jgi:branched-chain amino acid transport system ATP-binding protein